MTYHWDFHAVLVRFPLYLDGLKWTVLLTLLIFVAGEVLGLVVAIIRYVRVPFLSPVAGAFVEFFRTTPLYAQMIWVFFCLPIVLGVTLPAVLAAVIAFSLNLGAFQSEIFRAGILSISRGQRDAAFALGMTPSQALWRIQIPQAVNRVIPPTASMWVALFKDTALVSMVAVPDLMYRSRQLMTDTYRPLEVLTVTALVYFVVTYPQARLVDRLYERFRIVE